MKKELLTLAFVKINSKDKDAQVSQKLNKANLAKHGSTKSLHAFKSIRKRPNISKEKFWLTCLCMFFKHNKYLKMLNKAECDVRKELDLVRFIQRQRMLVLASLSTLNRNQQFVVDRMSSMVIHES